MTDSSYLVSYYSPCTIIIILRGIGGFYCDIAT